MAMADDNGNSGDSGNASKPMDENAIKDFVVKAVNGAVSTHLSRALEKRDSALEERMSKLLTESLGQRTTEQVKPDAGGDDKAGDAMKAIEAKYQKTLQEMQQSLERERSQREQERSQRLVGEERGTLRDTLLEAGVPQPLVPAAVAYLHGELKRVKRDDDGSIIFEIPEKGPTGSYVDRVSVKEGIERFLKTEEGKHYLPAKPAAGSGSKGGQNSERAPGGKASVQDMIAQMFLPKG
jgi:hypothetical protein